MSALNEIRELYAQLPTIACKGLCANSCGPIDMSNVERRQLAHLGVTIPVFDSSHHRRWAEGERLDCPALVEKKSHPFAAKLRMGKCSVYADRPLICRLWGVAESMPCPSGCEVSPRMLTDLEAYAFIFRANEIGGHPRYGGQEDLREWAKLNDDPEIGPLIARFIRGDQDAEPEIVRILDERRDG